MSGKWYGIVAIFALVMAGQACLRTLPSFPVNSLLMVGGGLALAITLIFAVKGR